MIGYFFSLKIIALNDTNLNRLLQEQEEQPDVWFRKTQKELYQLNCKKAADFLNCNQKDVFIVNNATYGELIFDKYTFFFLLSTTFKLNLSY